MPASGDLIVTKGTGSPGRYCPFSIYCPFVPAKCYPSLLQCVPACCVPAVVTLPSQGYAKLGDFGFAKQVDAMGRTYTFCGTPGYVAPENGECVCVPPPARHLCLQLVCLQHVCSWLLRW